MVLFEAPCPSLFHNVSEQQLLSPAKINNVSNNTKREVRQTIMFIVLQSAFLEGCEWLIISKQRHVKCFLSRGQPGIIGVIFFISYQFSIVCFVWMVYLLLMHSSSQLGGPTIRTGAMNVLTIHLQQHQARNYRLLYQQ